MGILERDPDATATTLERWLATRNDVTDPTVGDVAIPGSTGWSNETIFFEASWHGPEGQRDERLVARIAPSDYRVFPDDTFHRQYTVMRALAEHTDVPMATTHWFEHDDSWFGQPFWVMDRVDGDIPADAPPYAGEGWLAEASEAQQARAWWSGIDAMARIHRVSVDALDLPSGTFPPADDQLDAALDHYERFLTWAEEGEPHESARASLDHLRATRPAPSAAGPSLVWGDARLSNLIYRDFEVITVLDWEMCGIGDPRLDLGWWIFADDALTTGSGHVRLPGFPSAEETAAGWADRTGRSADDLSWFVLLGGLRFTVIMLRMGKLLHGMGFVPADFARDNLISQAMEQRLATRSATDLPHR
ncbi:MAG: phosphotransferase family protein [Acidimicrobiales bacterium]|nr:phosphotransferase family protein [Acidimicrobiales bacterium]